MAPTKADEATKRKRPAAAGGAVGQANRKGKKKKGKRRKSGAGAGGAAAAEKKGPAAAAADKRKEEEETARGLNWEDEQRARMIQAAKEYLQLWALREQGSGWRFNKTRQIWVLKFLYDEERVDKPMFKKLVLPYVAGLQGGARERVLAEAQGHVAAAAPKKKAGIDSDDDDEEVVGAGAAAAGCNTAAEQANQARAKRAKKVIKALGSAGGRDDID